MSRARSRRGRWAREHRSPAKTGLRPLLSWVGLPVPPNRRVERAKAREARAERNQSDQGEIAPRCWQRAVQAQDEPANYEPEHPVNLGDVGPHNTSSSAQSGIVTTAHGARWASCRATLPASSTPGGPP